MKKIAIAFALTTFIISCKTVPKKRAKIAPDKELSKYSFSPEIPLDPTIKKGVLSNGLTYYIRKNPKPEEKLELRLVIKAGSILETDKQQGLAHFMEHMNFNGTKNFKKNELVDYLQSIGVKFGAHLNAYTSFDETVYILPIPTDDEEKLEKGFQILEDWAFNALLTDEEIDKERGVVLEEYRLGLGAGKRMMKNYLPKLMHNSHYAERLPIGKKEILENFTYEDLRSFYKDWYRPNLMAVVAVGDVDVAVLEEKIKGHFGNYKNPKKPKERVQYDVPNHKETFVAIETDKEATSSNISLFYKDLEEAKPTKTIEDVRKNFINSLFSSMINARLGELRQLENPPFVYGYSTHGGTWSKAKNAYQSGAMSSETGQLKALKALVEENERVLRYGFQESELERAKKSLLNSYERSYKERDKKESKSYASAYVGNFLGDGILPGIVWSYENAKKMLPTITTKDCNALISGYIHDENRVIVFTGPEKEGIEKPKEVDVLKILSDVKTAKIEPYKDDLGDQGLMRGIKLKKGKIISEEKDTILDATKLVLSNGLKVTYKKTNFKNDQILLSAYSYGGSSLFSVEEDLKTAIARGALTEAGINGYSKVDLEKLMAGKIASVNPYISSLDEGFSGSSTPKDFETLFQLTHLYFTKLNHDVKSYNSFANKIKAYLENALSNPSTYFSLEFDKFWNKGNERFIGFPTKEVWENIDYDLAYRKYQERFADASDFNFYFVGNIDEAKLKEYAEIYLASLPSTNSKEKFRDTGFRAPKGVQELHIKKGKEPKSSVSITYAGDAKYNQKEAYSIRSLGEVLTIKLTEELREEESGVYGVRASGSMARFPYARYNFSISFPCGPENLERLKEKALGELQKIMDNGVSEKDLNKIKETQLLAFKEGKKKNGFWLSVLKWADYNGTNPYKYQKTEERINALTSEDLQKVANKYLKKNRVIATLNPED